MLGCFHTVVFFFPTKKKNLPTSFVLLIFRNKQLVLHAHCNHGNTVPTFGLYRLLSDVKL